MRSTLARRVGRLAVGATAAATLLLASSASALIEAPPSTVPIGGGTNSTITDVRINGDTTTLAQVAPGSTVAMHAKTTLGPGVNPSWVYWTGYGWVGAATASGCSGGTGGVGGTDPIDFTLTAPTVAGVYAVGAALGPDPCPWASPVPGPTVAKIVVADHPSMCALVWEASTKPSVAAGLCDKLVAAAAAQERGQVNVEANVLKAFLNQVEAQRGKALSGERADLLRELVGWL